MKDFEKFDCMGEGSQIDSWRFMESRRGFRRFELYGLTSQIRRCSASIGANIAEGMRKARKQRVPALLADSFGFG